MQKVSQVMERVLNEDFCSAFTEKEMKVSELGTVDGDVLRTIHITIKEVLDVLRQMKVDKP